jgi:hypothetical protein
VLLGSAFFAELGCASNTAAPDDGASGAGGSSAAGGSSGGTTPHAGATLGGYSGKGAAGAPSGGISGGSSSAGGVAGGVAGTGSGSCIAGVTHALSAAIPTVGIVEWSAGAETPEQARIEYGLDTSYGLSAPVDLTEPNYRTLLLGMKTSSTYHFRIVANVGGRDCTSGDFTLTTGPGPTGLRAPEIETFEPEQLDRATSLRHAG